MKTISDECHEVTKLHKQLKTKLTALVKSLIETFGQPQMEPKGKDWPSCIYRFRDLRTADIFVKAYWTGDDVPVATGISIDGIMMPSSLVDAEVWYDQFFRDELM